MKDFFVPKDLLLFSNSMGMNSDFSVRGFSAGASEALGELTMTVSAAAGASDPYWSNVVLCINPSGADGNTSVVDDAGRHDLAVYGNAQIDTSLGYPVIQTDGEGDYVAKTSLSDDWAFGTGDFCIEGFIRVAELPTVEHPIVCLRYYPEAGMRDNVVALYYGRIQFSDGIAWHGNSVPDYFATNMMNHFAVDRSSGTLRIFYNGVLEYTATVTRNIIGARPLYLFRWDSTTTAFNGYCAGIRITKGQSRYITNFTPPLYPFPTS